MKNNSDNGILVGHQSDHVLQLMRERLARYQRGGAFIDGCKLGLVVEGGAMRGVLPAGGGVALSRLGMASIFDEVYASSAGVMTAAYMLTGQPDLGIRVYYDHCVGKEFINLSRFWKMLDVDWLFEQVICKHKCLNVENLLRSNTRFFVMATDHDTGAPEILDVQHGLGNPLDKLKASMALPVFYNKAVMVGERRFIDGGFHHPLPLVPAIQSGCTHLFVMQSRPVDYVRQASTILQRLIFNVIYGRLNHRRWGLLRQYHINDKKIREVAVGQMVNENTPCIATVAVSRDTKLSRLCNDPHMLWQAANEYGCNVLSLFDANFDLLKLPRPLGG